MPCLERLLLRLRWVSVPGAVACGLVLGLHVAQSFVGARFPVDMAMVNYNGPKRRALPSGKRLHSYGK